MRTAGLQDCKTAGLQEKCSKAQFINLSKCSKAQIVLDIGHTL